MPAPVSASAGVARPLTPLGVKLALAACAPPALPLAAVPVVLRLLSRWPPCSSSSACSPQLAAVLVVLRLLPPAGRPARRPPSAPPAGRPARRPPPAPPADRPPVVLRLLPQLAALPVVRHPLPQQIARPLSSACSPSWPPCPSSSIRSPPADRPARRPPAVSADGKKHFQLWPGFMFFRAVQPKKSLEKCRFLSALHSFKGQNRFTWQNPIRSIGRNPGLCRATRKAPFSAFDSIRAAGI